MSELITFVFTDIVGSVDLKRQMPGRSDMERDEAYVAQILTPHRERIESDLARLGGRVVSTAGDGHFLVFRDTTRAARWTVGVEESHRDAALRTPGGAAVAVRMSLHVGVPQQDPADPDNFIGKAVDYAARLNDYATGGQILLSRSAVAILEDAGLDGVRFHRHGRRELRGIGPVEVHELVYDAAGARPTRSTPRDERPREWTVLPATQGLTEFAAGRGRAQVAAPPMRKIGNYELDTLLGSGGMGDVYKARHAQFGRARAVKIIKSHFVEGGQHEVIRRFYQEIKAVGQLEHPNVVVAIDSSTPNDSTHYLVMEFVDGVSAEQLIAEHGPLRATDACEIARQAAVGLQYIHQQGMVHRDIKPSNLMLTLVEPTALSGATPPLSEAAALQVPVVKILDLGLALLVGDDQQRLTRVDHRAMGTGMYMSPEQWRTTSVDIRADIYSLGCTLYHLLAGRPPFFDSDLRPEKAHEKSAVPPIVDREPLPRGLWEVLQRMLAKRPEDRYATPAEVAAALAPFTADHHLAELVEKHRRLGAGDPTRHNAEAETQARTHRDSETREGSSPRPAPSWIDAPTSRWWRLAAVLGLLAAVGVATWLANLARERRHSLVESRRSTLVTSARYAADAVARQISDRFELLQRLSDDNELRAAMTAVDADPDNEQFWKPVQDWVMRQKSAHDEEIAAESWFVTDRRGVQIARSPESESIGQRYAHRDYFHGRGAMYVPPADGEAAPIAGPHQSAVYSSTTTKALKVAFSVPVTDGTKQNPQVLGVLAMSVDLGEFNVLEEKLQRPLEVVLVDLRQDNVEATGQRGLLLHHRELDRYQSSAHPLRLTPDLLEEIDTQLSASRTRTESTKWIVENYLDLLQRNDTLYWGAVEPVVIAGRNLPSETKWLVMVQEPVGK
ncbi:MAG: protein kinase [Pirellulales bacterium]